MATVLQRNLIYPVNSSLQKWSTKYLLYAQHGEKSMHPLYPSLGPRKESTLKSLFTGYWGKFQEIHDTLLQQGPHV